ncbi:transporter substrate-binding domain-containing protein [Halobacteriovorax sp. JY17]|uniref:transporter substrate-binding domain-containing protein n=1 Tax=Halobacteriovorax sp. JY17 TaxID=2014617 RepID=UPI000C39563A|nr:transporter substrate-binding domain-containing protein [Halobacteriovorax sp. JY17]PIK15585.1 MAG: hypothetical protein CES88_02355 [Halobacteriovorax sp. JY17]
MEPWIRPSDHTGFIERMVVACLKTSGREIEFKNYPYFRRIKEFTKEKLDVVTDINEKLYHEKRMQGFYTGRIYSYKNKFFSLKKNNFKIEKISDLKDYSIAAWKGSSTFLSGDYLLMSQNNKKYTEDFKLKKQIRLLYLGRVQFLMMDEQIFKFYRDQLIEEKVISSKELVSTYDFLEPIPTGFLFQTKKMRDLCVENTKSLSFVREFSFLK